MCPSVWLSDWLSIFQGFKSACYPLSIELSLKYQEKMRSAPTFGCVGGSIRGLCPPWSFYILLVTFMGISPGGREKVPHGASHGNKRVRQGAPEGDAAK